MANFERFYFSNRAIAALDCPADERLEERIIGVACRYRCLMADSVPKLEFLEWMAIMDACNGTIIDSEIAPLPLWANVMDFEGLGQKWGVDAAELARKMRDLPPVQACALVEVVRRFWVIAEDMDSETALSRALDMRENVLPVVRS